MRSALIASLLLFTTSAHAATITSIFGGRIPCVEQDGVQFCAGTIETRVESWDGVPLDVSVTLPPAAMDGPFPAIVDLHGWSLGKSGSPFTAWALDGYLVISATARGFHGSCGSLAARATDVTLSNPNICIERGWTHLADARYESRDTQYLAGLLADEGLIIPDKVGVTGISYGGGQSFLLAALKDRVMLPDGSLTPWKSPGGLDMKIAAAAPIIGWTDLAYALMPTGTTLDYRTANPYGTRTGIQKQSWNATLYLAGNAAGYFAPEGVDPSADLIGWNDRIALGEPYDGDSSSGALIDEITKHHSAYYIDASQPPAPIFAYNSWTDDLFPADEPIRYWQKIHALYPNQEFALHFEDGFGHPRAGLSANLATVNAKVVQFFARHLKGSGAAALPPLETYTQKCGDSTTTGPHAAVDWNAIHPGEVRYVSKKPKHYDESAGAAANAVATDPLGPGTSCREVPATDDPKAATYRFSAKSGFTLMGSPTIVVDMSASNEAAQVAARLWDVAPDNTQALVTHAFYRPRRDNQGPQVFQLHPNGWHFVAGHTVKLELLGQSVPYGRAGHVPFDVFLKKVELRLPTLEQPGGIIKTPAAAVTLATQQEPPACPSHPTDDCRTPTASGASTLTLDKGWMHWRYAQGGAATGTEVTTAINAGGLALCVYDATTLVTSATAVGSNECGKGSCWTAAGTNVRSSKPGVAHTGVKIAFRTGAAGAATIDVASNRNRLTLPSLPLTQLPLRFQLRDASGLCWGARFAQASTNTDKKVVAASE